MIILKGKEAKEFERKMKVAEQTKISESEKKRLEENYQRFKKIATFV